MESEHHGSGFSFLDKRQNLKPIKYNLTILYKNNKRTVMELHVKDRLYFPQLLPQQNTFMEYAMKRSIMKKVGLTAEDQKKFEIKENEDGKGIVWNIEKDIAQPHTVEFTPEELEYIKKGCEALAEQPCPDDFWALVERIYDALPQK